MLHFIRILEKEFADVRNITIGIRFLDYFFLVVISLMHTHHKNFKAFVSI